MKSIAPRNQPQPTNKKRSNTTKCSILFVRSHTEALTKHSHTQFTPGMRRSSALISVDCLLNHLSKVIFNLHFRAKLVLIYIIKITSEKVNSLTTFVQAIQFNRLISSLRQRPFLVLYSRQPSALRSFASGLRIRV